MEELKRMLAEAKATREFHKNLGNQIEASAAAIREQAIKDCIKALEDTSGLELPLVRD